MAAVGHEISLEVASGRKLPHSKVSVKMQSVRKLLHSQYFLRFADAGDESAFVESEIAQQIHARALVTVWATTTVAWLIAYSFSYFNRGYLIDNEIRAATVHMFSFQFIQLVLCQTFLVIRIFKVRLHSDIVLSILGLLGAMTLPLSNPRRVGIWYGGGACSFQALYAQSECPSADWGDHYFLMYLATLYMAFSGLLPVRAKWSACLGVSFSVIYFVTSFPQGWSAHSPRHVVVITISLSILTYIMWAGQHRRELKDREAWLANRYLMQEVEGLAGDVADPPEKIHLDVLESAIRWNNIDTEKMRAARNSLLSLGWSSSDLAEKERSVRKRHSETFGVSVKYLLSETFTAMVKKSTGKDDPSFNEIGNCIFKGEDAVGKNIACPRDGKRGCSYLDTLSPENKGECTHFLSWSWSYKLSTVQSALRNWIGNGDLNPGEVYLWMCFFINNQHRILDESSKVNGSDNLEEVFETNLRRIGKLVALLDTWRDPFYLKRIWCIFEQYTAIKLCIDVDMILPRNQAEELVVEIEAGRSGILNVKHRLSKVNSASAKASILADENKVKRLIDEEVGFNVVDQHVIESMIKWVSVEVQLYLSNLILDDPFQTGSFTREVSGGTSATSNSSRAASAGGTPVRFFNTRKLAHKVQL